MNEIDSLLSQFQESNNQFQEGNNSSTPTLWGTPQTKQTPEDEDSDRLEQSIREVFSNKQLLNKALSTFLGVFAASGGVSLMTSLSIGAIASGTLGSIVLGLFFANTLSKLRYDGTIHIDEDFLVAAAQTTSVGVALWIAFDEHRVVSNATKTGKQRFHQEVKEYEVKPTPPSYDSWFVVGGLGVGLLAIALILRNWK
ncbi:hypothetical protein [Nodularia sp. LEGE 04288]|uniref:hypothetical protein n=1 Tax=Nodularia sp. LEGE 04288 TaxID=1828639 RepID=UPI001D11980F|nr:hypothetical protein [Nodularia sp. LEGE 04288]MCC2695222.1 hypothetical protein [Nodularia sp. LEGE 04288]